MAVVLYGHCTHCKFCDNKHPYPCEDATCREGNRKIYV